MDAVTLTTADGLNLFGMLGTVLWHMLRIGAAFQFENEMLIDAPQPALDRTADEVVVAVVAHPGHRDEIEETFGRWSRRGRRPAPSMVLDGAPTHRPVHLPGLGRIS